jgi:hypothetical protein
MPFWSGGGRPASLALFEIEFRIFIADARPNTKDAPEVHPWASLLLIAGAEALGSPS